MSNGLDQLRTARAQAAGRAPSRRVPPPKHPAAKSLPAENPNPPQTAGDRGDPADQPAIADPAAARTATAAAPAIRQSVHLDAETDAILEDIRAASRPRRVDANRSAVIRLALRRLAAELTPNQIVDQIEDAARTTTHQGPGRKLI